MNHGIGSIKRQAGGRGLFAEVGLDVEPSERSVFSIDLDADSQGGATSYYPTIQAAITFAEEKALFVLKRSDLFNLQVTLRRLIVTAADTTATAVFYATLLAIEDALEIEIPDAEVEWSSRELKLKF